MRPEMDGRFEGQDRHIRRLDPDVAEHLLVDRLDASASENRRDTALLVDSELIPVGDEEYPGGSGQFWAEPDVNQAAAAMREITCDRGLAERLGKAGRARIRELCGPRVVGARYVERLQAIGKAL